MVLVIHWCYQFITKRKLWDQILCLENLRSGQVLGEVQPFSCLCVFSLSKFIIPFIGDNFSCPSQKLKIAFPPSKAFFPFYVIFFFLPKSKIANRGSTHILHAGNSLTVRSDNQEPCFRCSTENRVKILHQCNDIWAHTECHCFSLVKSILIFNFLEEDESSLGHEVLLKK